MASLTKNKEGTSKMKQMVINLLSDECQMVDSTLPYVKDNNTHILELGLNLKEVRIFKENNERSIKINIDLSIEDKA